MNRRSFFTRFSAFAAILGVAKSLPKEPITVPLFGGDLIFPHPVTSGFSQVEDHAEWATIRFTTDDGATPLDLTDYRFEMTTATSSLKEGILTLTVTHKG
jgi:hypothetical protein